MASSPITSQQTDGAKVETMIDFIFLGSKITANDDCSHEIKRCLFHRRKAMTNLDTILKSRDITLMTKQWLFFPAVMYRKCCTQYASKFGKLSSAHRTGKGRFSFHSQRKAMPKNAQNTTQLHSSHMLLK